MGVYRSLLEEEIEVAGVLDDDNNVDLKEIEDIVADQDANKAEQDRAQEAEFADPGTSVDDIMEESAMAIYEFENTNAKIMQAVGLHELSEAAAGRSFIFESADDIKAFFKKIKDAVVAFFKKVWQVLQRWAGNLTAAFTTNKKLWEKHSAQIKAGYAKATASSDEKPKGYTFDGLLDENAFADLDKADQELLAKIGEAVAVEDVKDLDKYNISADDLDTSLKRIRSLASNGKSEGDGFAEAVKKAFTGEKKELWMSVEMIEIGLTDKKDMKKCANEFMKEAKKQFKSVIDKVNALEKKAAKLEVADGREKYMGICSRISTYMRSALSICQTCRNTFCASVNLFAHQSRKYALLYVKYAGKEKYKGFQKESTEYGFLGKFF